MARISNEQIKDYSKGGGSFFSLKDGESATVRFAYDTYAHIEAFVVHEFNKGGNYATIDCARQEGDPLDTCKWCALGNKPVVRVVLTMYNEETKEIQYWKRSGSWLESDLKPLLDEIAQGQTIAGQVYKIKRTGKTMNDTKYTIIPVGGNDGTTRSALGEIKDPFEMNIIKDTNCDFNPDATPTSNEAQPTRRTSDVF